MRVAPVISPAQDVKRWLQRQVDSALTSQRLVERCQIALKAAEGRNKLEIAASLGISRQKVARWRDRFSVSGRAGIEADVPGRGRKALFDIFVVGDLSRRCRAYNLPPMG